MVFLNVWVNKIEQQKHRNCYTVFVFMSEFVGLTAQLFANLGLDMP